MAFGENKTVPYNIRFLKKKLEQAEKLGLNLPEIFRQTLDKIIKDKTCPCCGQKVKSRK